MASNSIILLLSLTVALFCLSQGDRVFKSDPIAQATSTAKKAQAAAQATANVAKKYASGSTKDEAETCIETCGDAVDALDRCLDVLKAFNRGRIADLQTYASAALTDVLTCDDEFGSGEPAGLKKATQNAHDILHTLLGIINGL